MSILDRWFASADDRIEASRRAKRAIKEYGDKAENHLRAKLSNSDRKRSRRQIRLAIDEVRKH